MRSLAVVLFLKVIEEFYRTLTGESDGTLGIRFTADCPALSSIGSVDSLLVFASPLFRLPIVGGGWMSDPSDSVTQIHL